ncbi:MAG: hypothetical protein J1E01_07465 [Acetatifactor sp.]|nr:hypothetical protein [Acetatifactor sp.]
MEKNGQTVRVLDEHGTVIGYTYPKRAKGLVKKCRAEFVSDQVIRLYKQCPTYENMEDIEMDHMNFITINPKEWRRNPDGGSKTVCDRFVISNPLAGAIPSAPSMVEILSVGAWDWGCISHVTNGFQALEPNTEYHLVFWLNGGENDRSDETCQLQILFTDDNVTASVKEFETGLCYRLNRAYIKPLKKYNGWEYYDIPFTTTQARYTQFQFVADRAPMALMKAEEPDVYRDLEDVTDPYEKQRPQRHNIIFEDGWPSDNRWYSTENLARAQDKNASNTASGNGQAFYSMHGADFVSDFRESFEDMRVEISEELRDELEDLQEEILDSIHDELDIDSLKNEFMESVRGAMETLREAFQSRNS